MFFNLCWAILVYSSHLLQTWDGCKNDEMKSFTVINFWVQLSSVYLDPISIGTVLSPAMDERYSKLDKTGKKTLTSLVQRNSCRKGVTFSAKCLLIVNKCAFLLQINARDIHQHLYVQTVVSKYQPPFSGCHSRPPVDHTSQYNWFWWLHKF